MSVLDKFRLDGKKALVTGASRGLGRAMAVALAEAGADVAITARAKDALAETAAQIEKAGRKAFVIPCDVTDRQAITECVAQARKDLGQIDILINNAGIGIVKLMQDITFEEWNQMLSVNLASYFYFAQEVAPEWLERGAGKLINIASIDGLIAESHTSPYCASKGGVIQLTKALAIEWARQQINVNAIAPGYFLTEINESALKDPVTGPLMVKRIPFRRWGEPEELGPLAVYLASPASDFMTGETVVIDGGQVAK